jgi:phosphatidylethanolamine-binding protein (PEBP) family uncharacterized protein
MMLGCSRPWVALLVTAFPLTVACGGDDPAPGGQSGGTGGSGMTAGIGGTGGSAGKAAAGQGGTTGGGSGGAGGSAGASAAGGQSGAATGGAAGARAGGAGTGAAGRAGGAGFGAGSAGMGGAGAMGGMGGASGGMGGTSGGMGGAAAGSGGAAGGSAFTLTNPDFENKAGCSKDMASACDVFPPDLASYMKGANISPELSWTGTPAGTQSFALILQDLTNGNAHWAIWNIAGATTMLAADIDKDTAMPAIPAGSQQTNASFANSTTMDGYFGPGSACNVYEFLLYALSVSTFTPTSTTDANAVRSALDAAGSMVLGKASLRGRQNYNDTCT